MGFTLRTFLASTSVAVLLVAAAAVPATAATTAYGEFHYSDLIGGAGKLVDPTIGPCYTVGLAVLSATNLTDSVATVYSDPYCYLLGFRVDPGNTTQFQLASVRFSSS